MSQPTDHALAAFVEATAQGFELACRDQCKTVFQLEIAHKPVRLQFGGHQLLHLMRPLQHLVEHSIDENAEQSFDILVWEGPAGWLPPSPIWTLGQQSPLGEITGLNSGRFRIYFHTQS